MGGGWEKLCLHRLAHLAFSAQVILQVVLTSHQGG